MKDSISKKTLLLILDGWGHGLKPEASAITQANTPFIDGLYHQYPNAELTTFGKDVGLPEGQMGNSEVGHLNIGAGRIVYQELLRINNAIQDRSFHKNEVLLDALSYAKKENKSVHFMGLLSDGGVHSHINHLKALCEMSHEMNLENVYIHAFMDGRDTSPTGGKDYMKDILSYLSNHAPSVKLASIIGRYYAMDRDNRWERIKLAYDLLIHGKGQHSQNAITSLTQSYAKGDKFTDEFIEPIVMVDNNNIPIATIKENDVVIFFNFRTDRPRQITTVLSQKNFEELSMFKQDLKFVTMTNYDESFKGLDIVFNKENLSNTMGEVLSKAGKTQTRIAETEKYPHVTFFFSGGREIPFENENRIMISSPKVATYDLQPEMSAKGITDAIIKNIEEKQPDFICLNYANTDMVGHTGIFEAAIKAAEVVDEEVKKLINTALKYDYTSIIIADHGNSDMMINEDGTPNTAHTTNMVPCFLIDKDVSDKKLKSGKLADIAPTILKIMNISPPKEMTGSSLIETI